MTGRVSRRSILAGALGALVTGCAGVPGSGPVVDITKAVDPTQVSAAIRPLPGQQPDQIVQGFIEAGGAQALDAAGGASFAAARQFLTPQAQATWQSSAGQVVVLAENFRVDADLQGQVTITGETTGTLDADRVFRAGGGSYTRTVHLVKVDGQWRIGNPPAELVIRQRDFGSAFRARTLYFVDPTGTVLVPDIRYVPFGLPDVQDTRVMNLLLAGPRGVLAQVAQNRLDGASLRSNLATVDGVTKVDLTGIKPPNPAARRAVAAQIVYSLAADPDQVAITLEGVMLDEKQPVYTRSQLSSFDPDSTPGTQTVTSNPWYVNPGGRIASLTATDQMMWGRLGDGELRVVSAAQSKATGAVAAVTQADDGKAVLMVGSPAEYQEPRPTLKADTLSTPSFNRAGDQVWVVQNGSSTTPEIYQVSATSNGDASASRAKIGSKALEGKGPITDVELSPDGVRVAIVAGGRLYVGAVAPTEPDNVPAGGPPPAGEGKVVASITNLIELRSDLQGVGAVAFNGSTELVVASQDGQLTRTLRLVSIDGSDKRAVSVGGLPPTDVDAVAVSGDDMYVQVSNRILALVGSPSDGVWQNPLAVTTGAELAGTQPFFPD